MLYQPKFCCNCGEKIQRVDWNWLTSRRFCELCETQYKIYDFLPRILIGAGLFLGIAGFGLYLQKPENSLNAPLHQIAGNVVQIDKNSARANNSLQVSSERNVQGLSSAGANTSVGEFHSKIPVVSEKKALSQAPAKQIDNSKSAAQETIYFCGAQTKKGTPCSRRVKGGGRCWQHVGQPAMLPPEKLIAVQ